MPLRRVRHWLSALTLLAGMALAAPAWAQNSTPSQRVVAGCVGYGMGLADHLSGSPRNTPAHDQLFRPAKEECLRRGGPESMPNGLMFAPFYSPEGSSSGGGGFNAARYLPPGMEWRQAVQAGYDGCLADGTTAANAAGAQGSPPWVQRGREAVRACIARGGKIGGRYQTPPYLAVKAGLRALIEPSYACETLEDGSSICVDSNGNAAYCSPGTVGLRNCEFTTIITVKGDPYLISTPTQNFFNCPAGVCLTAIPNDSGGPHGGGPTVPWGASDLDSLFKLCFLGPTKYPNNNPGPPKSPNAIFGDCFLARCQSDGKRSAFQCLDEWNRRLAEVAAAALAASAGAAGKALLNKLGEMGKEVADILGDTYNNTLSDPNFKLAMGLTAVGLVALACVGTGVACLALAPAAKPAAAGLLLLLAGGQSAGGGGSFQAAAGASRITPQQAADSYCRGIVTRGLQKAGSNLNPVGVQGLVAICIRVIPTDRGERVALANALMAKCDRAGANAVRGTGPDHPVTKYSRAANECLRLQGMEIADFAQLPSERVNFANKLTGMMANCAEQAGLEWRGNAQSGAAYPPVAANVSPAVLASCLQRAANAVP